MENNWGEIANAIIYANTISLVDEHHQNKIRGAMLEFGNLVFEATKKECADKAELIDNGYTDELPNGNMHYFEKLTLDKESILNINKPNL